MVGRGPKLAKSVGHFPRLNPPKLGATSAFSNKKEDAPITFWKDNASAKRKKPPTKTKTVFTYPTTLALRAGVGEVTGGG